MTTRQLADIIVSSIRDTQRSYGAAHGRADGHEQEIFGNLEEAFDDLASNIELKVNEILPKEDTSATQDTPSQEPPDAPPA